MELNLFGPEDLLINLRGGSPALFPTDTLPALATLPNFASKLWAIKNRPKSKPFILMGSKQEDLLQFVEPHALEDAFDFAQIYWPGTLTMVLPSSKELAGKLNPGGLSIGMRVPRCEMTQKLLERTGPLATTSANLSGEKPSLLPEEVAKCFPQLPLLGPLPWPKPSGLASTVISWEAKGSWQLIRRGAVMPEKLQK